jgi:MYXO-CTERM domain-containing protein
MWSSLLVPVVFAAPLNHASLTDPSAPSLAPSPDLGETALRLGSSDPETDAVVGGQQAERGEWDDAVGVVFYGAYVGCTGTLIGPKVVLTAGHCVGGGSITHVVVGSNNWASNQGEIIEVDRVYEHPNSQSTYDVAVLILEQNSSYEPRALAIDCILDEYLEDGAPVQIVGYGATDEAGQDYYNTLLNEVATRVADADCDENVINGVFAGCQPSVSPGGEIAAGGNGEDACYGDSGGPLYLKTDDGDFLVGVTSRAFLGVSPQAPCRDGGIWVRPDAVIQWIEDKADGAKITFPDCNEEPEASVDDLETTKNEPVTAEVDVDDPDGDGDDAKIEVVEEPEHGEVNIDGLEIEYVPDEDFVGEDSFVLEITDEGTGYRRTGDPESIELEVEVEVQEGNQIRLPVQGCGCQTGAGLGLGAWGLGVLGLAFLSRRR